MSAPLGNRRLALAAALLLAACRAGGGAAPDAAPAVEEPRDIVLARLGDEVLTLEDARGTFESSHTGHGVFVQGEGAVRELTGRLVERRLFLAEAEALGLPDDPGVREAVREHRYQLARSRFWKREVDGRALVTEEEVEAFYAKTDMALDLRLVEVFSRELAESLRARALAGEDLAALARQESEHESRTFDGLLDYVRRGDLEPALEDAAFALEEPGDLTPVVPTDRGFAFARLEEKILNPNRPEREIMVPQIRAVLENRAKDELREAAEERLLAEAEARVDEALLTQERLLSDDAPETVISFSAGEELTLGALRESLDLDAVRAAPAEEVALGTAAIVRQWALEQALRRHLEDSPLLDEPDIVEAVQAYEREAVLTTLYAAYVYADVLPTDEEVRAYYEQNKETGFTQPAEVRLAYVAVPTEEEAAAILARVEAGEDFGTIAREESIDATSAMHGGRIGWVRPGMILPVIEERAFAMEVDEVAGPIETEQGWFVLRVLDRREPELVPFELAERAARRRLTKDRQQEAYAEWAARLRERAAIEIDEEGVRRAVAWLARAAEAAAAEEQDVQDVQAVQDAVTPGGHGADEEAP